MLNPLETLQQIFLVPAPELANLGDVVEIAYGSGTVIGTVVEGDPMLDDDGKTWFRVEYTSLGYYGFITASAWVTDEATIRIIR